MAAARATGNDTITTHVLRHTADSLWIKAGATPFLVMKAGGWASLDMVSKVYGHLWPSDVVELGRKVDALDWAALDRSGVSPGSTLPASAERPTTTPPGWLSADARQSCGNPCGVGPEPESATCHRTTNQRP
jgi:hypothetical protein